MSKCIATATFLAVAAFTAPGAGAQDYCTDRESFVAHLNGEHGEELVAAGLYDPEHIIELWTSLDGATWTLLLTTADGVSCQLASGVAWSGASVRPVTGIEG